MKTLEALQKHFDSPEGKEFDRLYFLKLERMKFYGERHQKYFDDHVRKIGVNLSVKILMDKYESDKYRDREYKSGWEPRCPLYDLLLDFFSREGRVVPENDYDNCFTTCEYEIGKWKIGLMVGQGSFIYIREL